jgi:pilus assembly protein CpaB
MAGLSVGPAPRGGTATDGIERLNRRLLVAALAFAALTALAVHAYLAGLARGHAGPTVPVVVATRNIPVHTVLTPAMLAVVRFAPADRPPTAASAVGTVVGSITAVPIFAGQPVVVQDLSRASAPVSLSYAIAPGERAFTVAVGPTTGVGEMIHPGDHVDVMGLFSAGTDGLRATTVITVSQDVLVLAVGQSMVGQAATPPASYSTVTLEVTPEQAAALAYTAARGELILTLRSVTDSARASAPPLTGAAVLGG